MVDPWERLPPSYTLPEGHSGELATYVKRYESGRHISLVTYGAEELDHVIAVFVTSNTLSPHPVYRVPGWVFARFVLEQGFVLKRPLP